jgi:subfamily B ATP-binding cassette protein MsbA
VSATITPDNQKEKTMNADTSVDIGIESNDSGPKRSGQQRMFDYLLPEWKVIVPGIVSSILIAVIAGLLAGIMGQFAASVKHPTMRALEIAALELVLCYIVRCGLIWVQSVSFAELSQRITLNLRSDLYRRLNKLSLSFFDGEQTGNLISTISNDVPVLSNGIVSLKDAVSNPVIVVGGVIWLFIISWKLTLITMFALPFIMIILNTLSKILKDISVETQNKLGDVTTTSEETLGAARLVRAFVAEDRENARFENQLRLAKMWTMRGVYRSAILGPAGDVVGAISIAGALCFGGHEVVTGAMSLKQLAIFVAVINRISGGVSGMTGIVTTWRTMQGAAERVFSNIFDVPIKVMEKSNAKILPPVHGDIEFEHVSFEYIEARPVLKDIDFNMKSGQVVAIVGESGSGKTTLSDLIPRFYDPTQGRILIDGQDIRDVTLSSLRSQIGIVDQVTNLFGGSVRENIAYGRPDASLEEVEEAARYANAHEFIMQMGDGYDTIVGQRGVQLSGGQRQRLAIARALLTNPRILILDEATSSLDTASEQLVQEALEKLMKGRTTLVIAHRLSTIVNADNILVMSSGRIVEAGRHAELLALKGKYSYLYETQYRASIDPESLGPCKETNSDQ